MLPMWGNSPFKWVNNNKVNVYIQYRYIYIHIPKKISEISRRHTTVNMALWLYKYILHSILSIFYLSHWRFLFRLSKYSLCAADVSWDAGIWNTARRFMGTVDFELVALEFDLLAFLPKCGVNVESQLFRDSSLVAEELRLSLSSVRQLITTVNPLVKQNVLRRWKFTVAVYHRVRSLNGRLQQLIRTRRPIVWTRLLPDPVLRGRPVDSILWISPCDGHLFMDMLRDPTTTSFIWGSELVRDAKFNRKYMY